MISGLWNWLGCLTGPQLENKTILAEREKKIELFCSSLLLFLLWSLPHTPLVCPELTAQTMTFYFSKQISRQLHEKAVWEVHDIPFCVLTPRIKKKPRPFPMHLQLMEIGRKMPQFAISGNLGWNMSTISSQIPCLFIPCWKVEWPLFFHWNDCMELPVLAKAVNSSLNVCNCIWWWWE